MADCQRSAGPLPRSTRGPAASFLGTSTRYIAAPDRGVTVAFGPYIMCMKRLLSDIIVCGICGGAMTAAVNSCRAARMPDGTARRLYRCRNTGVCAQSITMHHADNAVRVAVIDWYRRRGIPLTWSHLPPAEQRAAVAAAVHRVVIYPGRRDDRVKVELR